MIMNFREMTRPTAKTFAIGRAPSINNSPIRDRNPTKARIATRLSATMATTIMIEAIRKRGKAGCLSFDRGNHRRYHWENPSPERLTRSWSGQKNPFRQILVRR